MNRSYAPPVSAGTRQSLSRRGLLRAGVGAAALMVGTSHISAARSFPSFRAATVAETLLSWTDLTLALIEETKPSPPHAARALALVHVAMAEAANAGNQPSRAAITGAATTVLEQLFPQPANRIYPQAANPIAAGEEALRRSPAWTHGHARAAGQINLEGGHRIGRQVIAWGQADGSDAAWVGERPVGTGLWQPTPPAYREDPLEPMAGQWQPWVLSSGDALRPAPPPAWGLPSWEAELKGVQEAVAQRTPEQAAAVEFWAGGPGTVTPAGIWITIARDLIVRDGLDAEPRRRCWHSPASPWPTASSAAGTPSTPTGWPARSRLIPRWTCSSRRRRSRPIRPGTRRSRPRPRPY